MKEEEEKGSKIGTRRGEKKQRINKESQRGEK